MSQTENWLWKGSLFSRPGRTPGMIGRGHERQRITAFLASEKTTLHIVGVGGVGKTWLARWLAWEARESRTIGWVECSQQSVTVEGLVASIAAATGNSRIRNLLMQRKDHPAVGEIHPLQDSIDHCIDEFNHSHCILILEDFHDLGERVSPPLQYTFLRHVMQGLNYGKIVIVSRRAPAILDTPGLRPFQDNLLLRGLTLEETQTFLASRGLILQSALVKDVWLKTGGLPKALDLLAARLQGVPSPEQVITKLSIYQEQEKDWLEAQIQDVGIRSYKFLIAMSTLRRPESVSFCQKVWLEQDFQSRLDDLRSRCLLESTDGPDSILISNFFRDYIIQERVPKPKRIELHDRVSAVYLSEAKQDEQSTRTRFLVEAIWHASHAHNPERVLVAATELRQIPDIEDNLGLLGQIDSLVVQAAKETNDNRTLVDWSLLLGNRLRLAGDLTQAVSVLEGAYHIAQQHFPKTVQFQSLKLLAATHHADGRYIQAQKEYNTCLQLARSMNDPELELTILPELGSTQLRASATREAEKTLNFCIERSRKRGNRQIEAKALCKLARLYLRHTEEPADQKRVHDLLQEANNLYVGLNDLSGRAETHGLLGDFHRYRKDTELALHHYHEAKKLGKQLGYRAKLAITIGQMAFLARDQGDYKEALRLSNESLELNERLGNAVGKQIHLVLSGEILLKLGHLEDAYKKIVDALEISSDPDRPQPIGVASAYRALAKYYRRIGDYTAAKDQIERALAEYIEVETFQYARETWDLIGPIYKDWSSQCDAEAVYQEFDRIRIDYNDTDVYYQDRIALLAKLVLIKLKGTDDPSDKIKDLCETLYLLEIPKDKWLPQVIQFCIEGWTTLAPYVFQMVLNWEETDQRRELYGYWIAAIIRDGNANLFETTLERVVDEKFGFETQFALLEPLEPEIVENQELRKRLAELYVNGIAQEIGRCIRVGKPLPAYAQDVRKALHYLDSSEFEFIDKFITETVNDARDRRLVDADFEPVLEGSKLDLRDKSVALVGGHARVRKFVAQEMYETFNLKQLSQVPPSWEQHVSTKTVRDAVKEADLIVKVWKHMSHDLDDCLDAVLTDSQRKIVRYAPGSGKSSIVRTIQEYFQQASSGSLDQNQSSQSFRHRPVGESEPVHLQG